MLKRTLCFSNRGFLRCASQQLVYETEVDGEKQARTFPIEDLGFVVIETSQVTLTAYALQALAANNTAVVFCDASCMPSAVLQPLMMHSTAQKHVQAQLEATEALKNRLWRQTIQAKIRNQATLLAKSNKNASLRLMNLADQVKNGDPGNCEAQAARIYFSSHDLGPTFRRDPDGVMPNAALNYGYAILRAATARALVGSGLVCIVGIHHHNQYNSFVLADDIMEPYRPFVDDIVLSQLELFVSSQTLTQPMKAALLGTLTTDVMIETMRRPLMNTLSYTTASLVRCFTKEEKEIHYPEFPDAQ